MHSIITTADVKIYVIQKSKRHTLKILQHASDHKDPASGIDNLYLIEITYNGSNVLSLPDDGSYVIQNMLEYL